MPCKENSKARIYEGEDWPSNLRRKAAAAVIRPVPSNSRLEGSGVAAPPGWLQEFTADERQVVPVTQPGQGANEKIEVASPTPLTSSIVATDSSNAALPRSAPIFHWTIFPDASVTTPKLGVRLTPH